MAHLSVPSSRVTVALTLGLAAALLPALRAEATGSTTLVSVVDGAPVEYGSLPAISADGSTVVFSATVEGANGLYARDRSTGDTQLVNVADDGTPASWGQGIQGWDVSANGRYVVFSTDAPEFDTQVAEEGCAEQDRDRDDERYLSVPCAQVYMRDLTSGTTTLVSVDSGGDALILGGYDPAISADGQTVAFRSGGGQTTSGDYSTARVMVRDLVQGQTEEASVSSDEVPADGLTIDLDLSADGNTVVFSSTAGNLGSKAAADGGSDIYLRDRAAGTTTPAVPSGTEVLQQGESFQPTVSGDGDVVAFVTQATLSAEDSNTSWDVYVVAPGAQPTLVAPGATYTDRPQLSDDGQFLLFRGWGGRLGDTGGVQVAALASGAVTTVPRDVSGSPVGGDTGFHSISGDGRFVAWTTRDKNVVSADLSGVLDQAYVTDMTPTPEAASGTGSASTGTDPSLTDVIETTVSGSPGAVAIQELADASPPAGWSVLGQQVQITADPATSGFLTFTFSIDASITPFGLTPGDVDLLRNGQPLPDCSSPDDAGPCVAERRALPSGDWQFVAHSPHASVWAVAMSVVPADTIAPTITIDRPVDGAQYVLGQSVTAAYSCDDGSGSGVTNCAGTVPNGAPLGTAAIGTKQFTVMATDSAGNSASRTVSYAVVWPVTAFLNPIADPPVLNTMKAGGIVPVRFSLGGDRGMNVLAGPPQVQQVTCPSGTTRAVDELLNAKAAPLSYKKGRYTYAWATAKTWAGSCRQLTVTFADGQQRTAVFKLGK